MKDLINLSAVGVYSMGYKIGMLVQPILMNPFKNIFTPYKFEVYKEQNGREKLLRIFTYYNFIGWLIVLGLSLFANPAIKILATKDYQEAYTIVPIVAFAYFIWSLGEFYSLGLHITNRTMLDSWIVICGAAVNIGLNFLLIPKWGMYGAGTAVTLSYLVMTVIYFCIGQRYYRIGIHFLEPFKYAAICALIYFCYLYGKPKINNLCLEILFSSGLCLVYIMISFWSGLIPHDATKFLWNKLTKAKIMVS
jgi:O-antigen/teichoic acid export membrane protein